MDVEKYVMIGIIVVLIIGFILFNEFATHGSFQGFSIKEFFKTYKKIVVLEGQGAQNTGAFFIDSTQVKIIAKIDGISKDLSTIRLENAAEEFDVPLYYTLYVNTDANGKGYGEIIIKDIKESSYYLSIITTNNWEIEVYEYS